TRSFWLGFGPNKKAGRWWSPPLALAERERWAPESERDIRASSATIKSLPIMPGASGCATKVIACAVAITGKRKGATSAWLRARNPQSLESHARVAAPARRATTRDGQRWLFRGETGRPFLLLSSSCASAERTA